MRSLKLGIYGDLAWLGRVINAIPNQICTNPQFWGSQIAWGSFVQGHLVTNTLGRLYICSNDSMTILLQLKYSFPLTLEGT